MKITARAGIAGSVLLIIAGVHGENTLFIGAGAAALVLWVIILIKATAQ
ncbi:hypothetical protein [Actinomadura sp. NPDC049753]